MGPSCYIEYRGIRNRTISCSSLSILPHHKMADRKPNPCIVKWILFTWYLNSSPFGLAADGSTPFGRAITSNHRVMWPSKNPMELFFNAKIFKNDFKSKWNHDSTTSHRKHPVCQHPSEDTVKLTSVWWRVLGTNRIIGTWRWSLGGVMWCKGKIISRKNSWTFYRLSIFLHWSTWIL